MSAEYSHGPFLEYAQEQPRPVRPPYSPAPQPGVFWLPPVLNDRTYFVLYGIGAFFVSTIFLPQGIASFWQSHMPLLPRVGMLLFFYLLPGLLIAGGILTFKYQRRWNRINQRRQMAAAWGSASGVSLAEPHPFPNATALPPHFTIKLQTNWGAVFAAMCLAVGLVFLFWADFTFSIALLFADTFQQGVAHAFNSPFPFLPMIFALNPLVWLVRWSQPQRIEITPEGLIVKHSVYDWASNKQSWKPQMIWWQDARLFAIRGGKPGARRARYELSSPTTVVAFDRILRPHWWSRFQPGQPFEVYQAQMDALLALISARTGLPLYDVRSASEPEGRAAQGDRLKTVSTTLAAVLVGLSVACQMEGLPGVLFAKVTDGRPFVIVLEIAAFLLALAGVRLGYRAPAGNQPHLLLIGYLCLLAALIGLLLFPFGPFLL